MSHRDPVRAALAATLSAVLASRDEARRERDAALRQARRDRAELEEMRRQLAQCSVAHPARTRVAGESERGGRGSRAGRPVDSPGRMISDGPQPAGQQ